MSLISRREFLKDSVLFGAAAAALGPVPLRAEEASPAKKVGANDRIRVACIGFNGQGKTHLSSFAGLPDTIVTTICDVDSNLAQAGIKTVEDRQKVAPKFVQDLRRIMDDKNIDVVATATPNHWHALISIWAIQAGKDVYVEKPVSHNVWEGRRIVEFARHYKRIVQTGTQSRSNEGMRQALALINSGKIGKVTLARGLCYKTRNSIGPKTQIAPPAGVDYDLWLGPAPEQAIRRQRFHYDWHWFWDFGNGDLGNQGIHEMDKARWGLGKKSLPNSALSLGGRFGYEDAGETANTQICLFDYGDSKLIFEVRGLKTKDLLGARVGNIWYGKDGYVVSSNYSGAVAFSPAGEVIQKFEGGGNHYANFIKAVKSRKAEDLNADIEEGHFSSALCHLGNVSYRLGTVQKYASGGRSSLVDGREYQETLDRMLEHLKENGVSLEGLPLRVGRSLTIDPKTEQCPQDREASKMLTRDYRKGFVVPDKI